MFNERKENKLLPASVWNELDLYSPKTAVRMLFCH